MGSRQSEAFVRAKPSAFNGRYFCRNKGKANCPAWSESRGWSAGGTSRRVVSVPPCMGEGQGQVVAVLLLFLGRSWNVAVALGEL